ncbi:sensor histidine kinase [Ardenticatena maritima]|uniref:sensor histidine kinase n=1 Tax=Ardenticatena maritima TaxID=872965 RepID=UPI000761ABEC|nr:ATP-binding protein [Ardenticatena maritima]
MTWSLLDTFLLALCVLLALGWARAVRRSAAMPPPSPRSAQATPSPSWWRTALDAAPIAIVVAQVESAVMRVVYANQSAAALFGAPTLPANIMVYFRHHTYMDLAEQVRRQNAPLRERLAVEGDRTFQIEVIPWHNEGQHGVIFFVEDVTEQVRAQRARRELAGNLGHELRTPLAGMKVWLETLAGALDEPETAAHIVERLQREADAMTRLVDDLLSLALIESGRLPLRLTDVPLRDLIAAHVQRMEPLAREKQITITYDAPAECRVMVDRDRFAQVLTNVLDNAITFTPAGGRITIQGMCDDEHVFLRVQDTGPGIPPHLLPRIFERFFKIDRARTRGRGGSGIGLALARHIVEAHGGRIEAANAPEGGALFTITLPRAQ